MEIEVKFRVDFEEIREKIENLGSSFLREEIQEDLYFSLQYPHLLRVRRIINLGKSFLTYKLVRDPGKNEEFEELEVEVSNFETTVEILKRLGFREDVRIKKRRLVYRLENITFELNLVEGLGAFLDIEVISDSVEDAKRTIWEVAEKLGLSQKDVEPRLYQELIKEKYM